ncbi:MAG: HAD family hydrolase, partial [Thermoanaerobaculia bacterium]|nr:HAD family hydrolase [Thermoanaerobaculia bacterium]
ELDARGGRSSRPYPGIRSLLAGLDARDVTMAVVTNKPQRPAELVVDRHFPGLFRRVRGWREGGPRKPEPAFLGDVLDDLDLERHEVVLVGDSEVDVAAARRAEIAVVAVGWGFRSAEELAALDPDGMVDEPAAVLAAVEAFGVNRAGARA